MFHVQRRFEMHTCIVIKSLGGALEMHLLLFVPAAHSKLFTGEFTSGHTEIESETEFDATVLTWGYFSELDHCGSRDRKGG